MAKLSKVTTAEAVAKKLEVQRIRSRYADALRLGFSTTEAAELAQGRGATGQVDAMEAAPITTGSVQTAQAGQRISVSDVPPGWQELPWPHLKSLADAINGKDVKSRKVAVSVIERFIASGEDQLHLY